jgi:hypothetical protein
VTSRLEETLGGLPKTVLKPLKIDSGRLLPFMSAYLEAKGKQDLFEDFHYLKGCDRLNEMVKGRSITVLLARLYLEHMIEARERTDTILPNSVPKLMLSYLNQLNRPIEADNKRDDLAVQRDAQAIAWACLQQTYRPTTIKKTVALAALKALDETTSPQERLTYLEKRLQVLQTPEPGTAPASFSIPWLNTSLRSIGSSTLASNPTPKAPGKAFLSPSIKSWPKPRQPRRRFAAFCWRCMTAA